MRKKEDCIPDLHSKFKVIFKTKIFSIFLDFDIILCSRINAA